MYRARDKGTDDNKTHIISITVEIKDRNVR